MNRESHSYINRLTFIFPGNLMGTEFDLAVLLKYHIQQKKPEIIIYAKLQELSLYRHGQALRVAEGRGSRNF